MLSRLIRPALAGVAVAALVAAGCGDDDDAGTDAGAAAEAGTPEEESAAGGGDDIDAYCAATLAIETVPEPEIDFENATPDEMAAAMKDWAATEMRPLADDVLAVAPDELADDLDVASGAVDDLAETGDFMVWESPNVVAATDRLHAFDLENCGWSEVAVTTTEYEFDGLPTELPAGTTSFELTNDGAEVHEVIIVRRNDGVTMPAEELLALPEEEARSMVTDVAVVGPANPGDDGYGVTELEPGEYIALCFIPTGMVSLESEGPPAGPPHAMHGMVTEFTVS